MPSWAERPRVRAASAGPCLEAFGLTSSSLDLKFSRGMDGGAAWGSSTAPWMCARACVGELRRADRGSRHQGSLAEDSLSRGWTLGSLAVLLDRL